VQTETILIGVDGGASEIRAHEILTLPRRSLLESPSFGLGVASASRLYDTARGFRPVPLPTQLLAFDRGHVEPGGIERAQGRLWVEAASEVVLAVASQAGSTRARLGVCMPGLKTKDGRGIAVMKHGPRIPDYLVRLEELLAKGGLALSHPVARLSSDGEACAHGEEAGAQGRLRGVSCAYYVGGGTGIAEAIKADGRIHGLDAFRGQVRKAWQLETGGGKSLEDALSPKGMNAAFAQAIRRKLPLDASEFPERRAAEGDEHAKAVLRRAAEALADLVVDRMLALRRGLVAKDPAREGDPDPSGSVRIVPNTILDRVVVGQRLGQILADPAHAEVFRLPSEAALARRILETGDGALRKHYLDGSSLESELLVPSLLRAAPAIGAAAIEVLETTGPAELSRTTAPPPF
jgi:predicted NBD/HSP70 family sugar kinase